MEPAFIHHVDCKPGFYSTTGTKSVSNVRFCRRNRNLAAKYTCSSSCFCNITVVSRSSMCINISNFVTLKTCRIQSKLHTDSHSFAVRASNMSTVSVRTKTNDFSINFSTTFYSVFQIFKNQSTSTFSNNKTITVLIKWARSSFWMLITNRSRTKLVKNCSIRRTKLFCTTTNHNILKSVFNSFVSITNRLRTRSTSFTSYNHTALKLVSNFNVSSTSMWHTFDVSRRIYLCSTTITHNASQFFNRIKGTHRRTISYTSTAILKFINNIAIFLKQASHLQSKLRSMIRKQSNSPHSANKLSWIFRQITLSRTSKLSIHTSNVVPFFHIFNTILIRFKLFKSFFPVLTKTTDHSSTSNNNTSFSVWFNKIHIFLTR